MTTGQNALSTVQVFISHVHEDNAYCEPLLLALDAWDVDYWFDKTSMRPGDAISAEIHNTLTERNIFIRICTASMQHRPRWVQVETDMFLGLKAQEDGTERGGGRRFISLIMDAGFRLDQLARDYVYVDAYNKPPRIWLREVRKALGLVIEREGSESKIAPRGSSRLPLFTQPTQADETREFTPEEREHASNVVDTRPSTTKIYNGFLLRPTLDLVAPPQPVPFELKTNKTIIARKLVHEIRLNDETVSELHAIITRVDSEMYIISDGGGDQGSTNGTFVNGKKIGDKGCVLSDGDQITVGQTILRFTLTG